MTQAEWREGNDPEPLLAFLRDKASDRKLRLFACACCRQIWPWIEDADCQRAVEISELYADEKASGAKLSAVRRKAEAAASLRSFDASVMMRLGRYAKKDAAQAAALAAAKQVHVYQVAERARAAITATHERPKDQCALLRDLFGNPFRPVTIHPSWLRWNDGTVPRIAQGIYEERAFDRLPILHDALLDAGCDNDDILAHCRGAGPHVRGCWVIDLLLGKA